MTDTELLTAVETALGVSDRFTLAIYAHARLRVLHGRPLKPAQRTHLLRLLELVHHMPQPPAASPGTFPRRRCNQSASLGPHDATGTPHARGADGAGAAVPPNVTEDI